jgi:pilus assembly protein CpaE
VIVIADPAAERRETIAAAIAGADESVHVASLESLEDRLATFNVGVRVAVLGPGFPKDDALGYAEKVERERTGVATLLVVEELEATLVREALRSGVDDVLTIGAGHEEWLEAIGRARARVASEHDVRANGTESGAPGRVVTVFSTKGGVGCSMIASNLAVLAARRTTGRVALVDLDLQAGDLAIMLQLNPALSIHDAAQSAGRLDPDAMQAYLTPYETGISLLAAPTEPSLADQVDAYSVKRIIELVRALHPLTIIDTPSMFTEHLLTTLDASDRIVLVGSMDVPSVKNLRLALSTLQQLGHPREHVHVVMNRSDSKVGLRTADVERSLGTSVDVHIPSTRDVVVSVNQGKPLATTRQRSAIVSAIDDLVPSLVPSTEIRPGARRRRRQ